MQDKVSLAISKVKEYAEINNYQSIKDWYNNCKLKNLIDFIGSEIFRELNLEPYQIIQKAYPSENVIPWKLDVVPPNFWDQKENRVSYLKWFENEIGIKEFSDWYSITWSQLNKKRGGSLRKYNDMPGLLKELYPERVFDHSLNKEIKKGLSKDINFQKKLIIKALQNLNLEITKQTLLNIKRVDLRKTKSVETVLRNYKSTHQCLIKLFPEYSLHLLDFQTQKAPIKKEDFREIVEEMGRRMGFSKPEDWYLCGYEDFDTHRIKSIRRFFGDSVSNTIMGLFPELNLQKDKFIGVSKTQDRIYGIVKCLFPENNIFYNHKHNELRFKDSGRKMEIDIFLPELNLGFEIQGKQHRENIKAWGESLKSIKERDKEKAKAAKDFGINLIEIHDNEWDGQLTSFLKILDEKEFLPTFNPKKLVKELKKNGLYDETINISVKEKFGIKEKSLIPKRYDVDFNKSDILRFCDLFFSNKGRYPNPISEEDKDVIADPENPLITWKLIASRLHTGLIPGIVTLGGLLSSERNFNAFEEFRKKRISEYNLTLEEWDALTRKEKTELNLLSKKQAEKYGIEIEKWDALDNSIKLAMPGRWSLGIRNIKELTQPIFASTKSADKRKLKASKKYGITLERWNSFNSKEKQYISSRFNDGIRGMQLFEFNGHKNRSERAMKKAAEKYQIPIDKYKKLTPNQRIGVIVRFKRGVRGFKELTAGYFK